MSIHPCINESGTNIACKYDDAKARIDELEAALNQIWLQLALGQADIPNIPVMRVNIGALIMHVCGRMSS